MSNIYKTSWLLSSCWAYLPIGNGITTLHHNPLVGWGEGGVPRGGKVKQESLAWFSVRRTNQASSKLLSFTWKESLIFFAMYLLGMSSIGISVNIIGKPYQHSLYTDLAWASSSGSLHRELPVNIKVNLQIGVKHTDTMHLSQSDFCIFSLMTCHYRCKNTFSEHFSDSSLPFPPKGRGVVPQTTDTKTYPGLQQANRSKWIIIVIHINKNP